MFVESVNVPAPLLVSAMEEPEMIPETLNVFPEFTFHVWLAPSAMGVAHVKLFADEDRSMPLAPSVNVPEPVTPISVSAAVMLMPPQDCAEFIVKLAPSELLFHMATSPEPGTALPVQLAPAVRSAPVDALVTVPAKADGTLAASKLKHTTNLAMVALQIMSGFQVLRATIGS